MAHHLIYIPNKFEGDRGEMHPLARVGLADHVAGQEAIAIANGPDGGSGSLYAWRTPTSDRRLHFKAEEQIWSPAAQRGDLPAGRFYVGTWIDSPPTADELRRPGHDAWGEPIRLGGKEWLLPPVDLLPKTVAQFPDGTTGVRMKREYVGLGEERGAWMARLAGPPQMVSLVAMARFIVACLAVNYRIDLTLALHLELFDEENTKEAMKISLRPQAYYLQRNEG